MEIHRDRTAGTITISQTRYIQKILTAAGMQDANTVRTPLDHNITLRKTPENESYPEIKPDYQSLLGSLMYAALATRPDIVFAVHKLSQFSSNPSPEHMTALKHCYRYLKGTADLGITFSRKNDEDLELYSDADWGNDLDDRRSVSGYVSIIAGGAATYSSKKQATVAQATHKAKYMALSHTLCENIWLRTFFSEMGLPPLTPTSVRCDNQGTIAYSYSGGYHARSKHIDIKHHFVRECIASKQASVTHCTSVDNIADIFTKALPRATHELLVAKLGMTRVRGGVL